MRNDNTRRRRRRRRRSLRVVRLIERFVVNNMNKSHSNSRKDGARLLKKTVPLKYVNVLVEWFIDY